MRKFWLSVGNAKFPPARSGFSKNKIPVIDEKFDEPQNIFSTKMDSNARMKAKISKKKEIINIVRNPIVFIILII